ncbi:unnamed protein product, partial [Sphacelaria rigidula]
EGCSTKLVFGAVGSMTAEFCSTNPRTGRVNKESKSCGEEGWFKLAVRKKHTVDEAKVGRQDTSAHRTAAVSDIVKLHTGEGTPVRSPSNSGGGTVVDVRGTKRKRAGFSGSGTNNGVGARRSAFAGPRSGTRTGHPASRPGGISSEARAEGVMKVELAVPSTTHSGDRIME